MLVKLSGDTYINTERICSISKEERPKYQDTQDIPAVHRQAYAGSTTVYTVWFESNKMTLSEKQGQELLLALKPSDATRARAKQTLIGQLGAIRWESLSEDAQYDAISAEVEREHE